MRVSEWPSWDMKPLYVYSALMLGMGAVSPDISLCALQSDFFILLSFLELLISGHECARLHKCSLCIFRGTLQSQAQVWKQLFYNSV